MVMLNETKYDLVESFESLQNLLKMVKGTRMIHDKYLVDHFSDSNYQPEYVDGDNKGLGGDEINSDSEEGSVLSETQMKQSIAECVIEYRKVVADKQQVINKYNRLRLMHFDPSIAQQKIKDMFAFVDVIEKLHVLKLTDFDYELQLADDRCIITNRICQFDLKCTKLPDKSTIDCDNTHVKIGSTTGYGYSMILPDKENAQGYKSGQHCFRMYYKNPQGPRQWLLFGIYKYGIVPKDTWTHVHETSWGIGDDGNGRIQCNGQNEYDKSNMSFLYSLNENQIDMFVDFDKGILSYSIVDDDVKNRIYTFSKKFDTNIAYTVHLNFWFAGTEVQIAKINVDMFGKNKTLVQWPIEKYDG